MRLACSVGVGKKMDSLDTSTLYVAETMMMDCHISPKVARAVHGNYGCFRP